MVSVRRGHQVECSKQEFLQGGITQRHWVSKPDGTSQHASIRCWQTQLLRGKREVPSGTLRCMLAAGQFVGFCSRCCLPFCISYPLTIYSLLLFIVSPVHKALGTSLWALGHRVPSIGRTTLKLEIDPSGDCLGQPFAVTPSTNTPHEGSMWARPTTSGAAQLKHLNSSDHLLAFSHARVNWCWFYCMGSLETPWSSALLKTS